MSGETIKSFLVGLGFDVDESSLAKFNKSITMATVKVAALSTAILAASGAIGKAISGISSDFEDLGYQFRIIAPAINKALVLRNDMLHAYAATGMNIAQVVSNAVKLNMSLARTKNILTALYQSVGSRFFETMTKQSDMFRNTIYKNLPKIQNALEKFVKFVFKALEAVVELGTRLWSILTRVYDFFSMLDSKTDGWSTIILGVIAAWKLLNLSFLATPLGALIAGFVALLALFDDFKTFQEGGKSLFDWGPVVPIINGITQGFKDLWGILQSVGKVLDQVYSTLINLFTGNFKGALDSVIGSLTTIIDLFYKIIGFKNGLAGFKIFESALGDKLSGFFGGNAAGNVAAVNGGVANPVGSNVQNAQTNQNVHQQTNINVMGAADANQTGKAVASQQGRVNRDMVDNMVGSTR